MRGPLPALLALVAVLAGGGLFYLALRDAPEDLPQEEGPEAGGEGVDPRASDEDDMALPPQPAEEDMPTQSAPGGVPRILPADAALEDLRDALVARDTEALEAAVQQIARASSTQRSLIMQQLPRTNGESVRGVALVALGRSANGIEQAWIADRLGSSIFPAEQLGALLGLCTHKREGGARVAIERFAGLGVSLQPIANRPQVWAGLQRLLDREPPESDDSELLALMGHALRQAAPSVFFDKHDDLRRWLRERPSDETRALREQLAAREDLSEAQRRSLR